MITAADLARLTNTTHGDYKRTVELYEKYKSWVTGDGLDAQLQQIVQREDEAAFAQRKRLTAHIIPSAVSRAKSVFQKGLRSNAINLYYSHDATGKVDDLKKVLSEFYSMSDERAYLDEFIADMTFIDPNGWLIVDTFGTDGRDYAKTFPTIVYSPDALNYQFTNGILDWLLIRKPMTYTGTDGNLKQSYRYTLYGTDGAIVAVPIADDSILRLMKEQHTIYEFNGQQYFQINDREVFYVMETFYKLTAPVACRWGYLHDALTDHRTFVSVLEGARPYFDKALKAVSEFDLGTTLHAFPQKIQYAPRCTAQGCVNGVLTTTGGKCPTCSGTGYMSAHTSGQDIITLGLPRDPAEAFNLGNFVSYVQLPIDVLNFQNEHVNRLSIEIQKSIFNSDIFTRAEVTTTATEKTIELQSVYDTLYSFAKQYASLWKYIVWQTAEYMGVSEGLNVIAHVKQDFKLKTYDEVLSDLQAAKTAGAGMAIIDGLEADAASVLYKDTPELMKKYSVMAYFDPYRGKTEQERMNINSSLPMDNYSRVLYTFYGQIFTDIEIEIGADVFYNSATRKQRDIIREYVERYTAMMTVPDIDFTTDTTE